MPIDMMIPGESEPISNLPEFKAQVEKGRNFDISYKESERQLIGSKTYESCRQIRKIPRIFREEKSSKKAWIEIISLTSQNYLKYDR